MTGLECIYLFRPFLASPAKSQEFDSCVGPGVGSGVLTTIAAKPRVSVKLYRNKITAMVSGMARKAPGPPRMNTQNIAERNTTVGETDRLTPITIG
jgi:hypothetical protein